MNLEKMSDKELMILARKNGTINGIFDVLYKRHKDFLVGSGYNLCKDRDEAEDLVSETFIRFYQSWEKYEVIPGADFKSWLYILLEHRFLDSLRKKTKHENIDNLTRYNLSIDSFEKDIFREEKYGLVRKAVDIVGKEKPKYSEIIRMRYFFGMADKDIADSLGIPGPTARTRLMHAKKYLGETLNKMRESNFFYG